MGRQRGFLPALLAYMAKARFGLRCELHVLATDTNCRRLAPFTKSGMLLGLITGELRSVLEKAY